MKELEDKVVIDVSYDFTQDEQNAAFKKLRAAAKSYDRTHPASLGLNGFEASELTPAEFKEMLKVCGCVGVWGWGCVVVCGCVWVWEGWERWERWACTGLLCVWV